MHGLQQAMTMNITRPRKRPKRSLHTRNSVSQHKSCTLSGSKTDTTSSYADGCSAFSILSSILAFKDTYNSLLNISGERCWLYSYY